MVDRVNTTSEKPTIASASLPTVDGARMAQPLDAMRIAWWAWRGRRYTARASRSATRALRIAAAMLSSTVWPAAALRRAIAIRSGRRRYYFSHADTAVLAVRVTRHGWLLADYCSERPGGGQGWWLRTYVLPEVYRAADLAGVEVRLTGTPRRVAESCTAETPGLRPSGRPRPGGTAMLRPPQPLRV